MGLGMSVGRITRSGVFVNDTVELPYPDWQGPLQEAILEFDREKLSEKALKAESRILERLRQLETSNNGNNERDAINHGLSLLRTIRRDRLDYPDWQPQ
jgi:hypothetical protein